MPSKKKADLFAESPCSFRVFPDIKRRIDAVVRKDRGEKYDNESHFFRVAVIRLLREEEARR